VNQTTRMLLSLCLGVAATSWCHALSAQPSPGAKPGIDSTALTGPPKWIDLDPYQLAPRPAAANPDAWLDDPFRHLGARMGEVVDELAVKITEDPVPRQQARIVSDLDTLIALIEKASSGGAGGRSGANPTRPANESVIMGGPGGQGELLAPKKSRREWADLPPNERRKILQSSTDGYPPGYRDVVEDYFNRLAVERPVNSETDDAE
jgi:hypothetical protein